MTAARLTDKQTAALAVLASWAPFGATPGDLAEATATSNEGAAATASSLVRRGLAVRYHGAGHVAYRITAEGKAAHFATLGIVPA